MSKTITLYNVDKIVSSAGTEVEIDNMSAGGSASAAGLALTRSEDSQNIDYAFNEGGNTHEADGHSSTATHAMFAGGDNPSDFSANELRSFTDQSENTVSYGAMTIARNSHSSASNGSSKLIMGGNSSNSLSGCEIKSFADSSNFVSHGNLSNTISAAAASSDGAKAMISGGSADATNVEFKNFSDNSYNVSHGVLASGIYSHNAVSDGTTNMNMGGYDGSGTWGNSSLISKKQFASSADSVSSGDLAVNKRNGGAGSNGTIALYGGGIADGDSWQTAIETKNFADDANSTSYGNLTFATLGIGGCANETAVLFAGGRNYSTYYSDINYKTFDSNADGVSAGSLSQAKQNLSASSGNA